jgi:hypothetical protein
MLVLFFFGTTGVWTQGLPSPHADFVFALQTTKVTATERDYCLVKIERH